MQHTENPFGLKMTIISSLIMSILDLVMMHDSIDANTKKNHTKGVGASSY